MAIGILCTDYMASGLFPMFLLVLLMNSEVVARSKKVLEALL